MRTGSATSPVAHPGPPSAAGSDEQRLRELEKRNRQPEQEHELLRGRGPTPPATSSRMIHPLVTDLADEGIPVVATCRVLGFSEQAYDKCRADPVSQRGWDDAHLLNAAVDVHHDEPEFGDRSIADELAGQGRKAGRNRVDRLCTLRRAAVNALPQARTGPRARPAGPRRPSDPAVQSGPPERAVADRHHRAPDD